MIHRIATSGRYNDGLQEIANWPLDDVLGANDLIDAYLFAEQEARDAAEAEAKAAREAARNR